MAEPPGSILFLSLSGAMGEGSCGQPSCLGLVLLEAQVLDSGGFHPQSYRSHQLLSK